MGLRRVTLSSLAVMASGVCAIGLLLGAGLAGVEGLDGHLIPLAVGGAVGVLGAGAGAIGAGVRNRTAVRELDDSRHAARHDALTGLVNRAELHRNLEASLARATRDKTVVGVLFLDLNRFKVVNDTLGHEAGDELLKVVAGRLRATIRSTDLAARLGGDEFVVVCRDLLVADSVLNVASQVQRRLREPISLGGTMHEIGASIGIAIAGPGDERDPDALLHDADTAMYRAKRERIPYAVFDAATRSQQADRARIEGALISALDNGEFVVFYQPVLDVVEARLVGFEALLRWRHPDWGLVEPADFLPIANSVGLMAPIGQFVIREAGAQMAVWNHTAPRARELTVSVNLAEQQLTDPNLVTDVAAMLEWSALDPGQFVVEVSESLLSRHTEELDPLRQVRELGVGVAIDGFGTGGLALRHTSGFDIASSLKIDRSFTWAINHDPSARAAVQAMVAMARPFGLAVVVEGVEDPEQMEFLHSIGIRWMQGYLFQAPAYADLVDLGAWFVSPSDQQEASVGLVPVGGR